MSYGHPNTREMKLEYILCLREDNVFCIKPQKVIYRYPSFWNHYEPNDGDIDGLMDVMALKNSF